mmetsp:Transcript_20939/g.72243  ORF Transcript_20939/g.72243 Transcript_20939/m.72243 type:complete len:284 (+) Transcript_20939:2100-2951(+)
MPPHTMIQILKRLGMYAMRAMVLSLPVATSLTCKHSRSPLLKRRPWIHSRECSSRLLVRFSPSIIVTAAQGDLQMCRSGWACATTIGCSRSLANQPTLSQPQPAIRPLQPAASPSCLASVATAWSSTPHVQLPWQQWMLPQQIFGAPLVHLLQLQQGSKSCSLRIIGCCSARRACSLHAGFAPPLMHRLMASYMVRVVVSFCFSLTSAAMQQETGGAAKSSQGCSVVRRCRAVVHVRASRPRMDPRSARFWKLRGAAQEACARLLRTSWSAMAQAPLWEIRSN